MLLFFFLFRNPAKKEVVAAVKDPNHTSWPRSIVSGPEKTLRAKPRRKETMTETEVARVAAILPHPRHRLQKSRQRSK